MKATHYTYYTDSNQSSIWVLSEKAEEMFNGSYLYDYILTCFAAKNNSGFHIGQTVKDPKLENSNWQPLEGSIEVNEILC
jgi:hypothetical protein